jgi:hypothetical protein
MSTICASFSLTKSSAFLELNTHLLHKLLDPKADFGGVELTTWNSPAALQNEFPTLLLVR